MKARMDWDKVEEIIENVEKKKGGCFVRMSAVVLFIVIVCLLTCCSPIYGCPTGDRYTLIKATPTMNGFEGRQGWRLVFVNGKDTVTTVKRNRYKVGANYSLQKEIL